MGRVMMQNDKKTISANDLNKYTYCPWQWYYERLYGRKYIREQYQARNHALRMADAVTDNFNKGLKFHRRYLFWAKLRRAVKLILLAAVLLLAAYYYFKGF